jgi:hypothetical protein
VRDGDHPVGALSRWRPSHNREYLRVITAFRNRVVAPSMPPEIAAARGIDCLNVSRPSALVGRTLDIIETQRVVRLLVKEILVSDDSIVIRHSIPLPTGPSRQGRAKSVRGREQQSRRGFG